MACLTQDIAIFPPMNPHNILPGDPLDDPVRTQIFMSDLHPSYRHGPWKTWNKNRLKTTFGRIETQIYLKSLQSHPYQLLWNHFISHSVLETKIIKFFAIYTSLSFQLYSFDG